MTALPLRSEILSGAVGRPRSAASSPIQLAGQRQQTLALGRQRLMTGLLLFCIAIGVLVLRLADLSLLQGRPTVGANRSTGAIPVRGDIYDRNNVELARTFEAYGIAVAPRKLVGNPRVLAEQIAAILPDKTVDGIYKELTARNSFRYISRRVLPEQAKRINDLGEPAITLEREPERLYPNLNLAAHVIGYAVDGVGKVGVEKAFDHRLSDPSTRGTPMHLSIDARVQQALESEMGAVLADQRAQGAAGIVLDVQTGEVLALASLPDFNPNAPGKSDPATRYNKVSYGVYELGSTFKTLTIAMALDTGVVTSMNQKYDATNPIRIAGFTIHDDHALRRPETIPEIFIHSSNIGTAKMAAELGRDRQRAYLDKLGFLKQAEIELPERASPHFPPLSNWGELATMTIGFGHGLSVSLVHLASAYAAVVNGGVLRPATLLKVEPGHAPAGTRVFSPGTSDTMRALLRLVVTDGTGRKADAPGYRVGGKTGTAEKLSGGRYSKHANVSTFAAAFPMDHPRYVVVTMIDDPQGSKATYGFRTAGMVIAPAVSRIVQRIGPILGVTPDVNKDVDVAALLSEIHDKAAE
ncbi:penicillin-binding protein 2 [Polymorphobacter arshaanensis]|uniref:Penicillin-binding protein 2 n=1 Tax=Glacieibacterium arshaanense TaxID=2511025 RepID=A0A4Y9ENN8_9SPHN|nr:penicillin-binding protein 2 [Polymorphobacter arshaanensis]TFU03330.1 penicillin-binding protein 2 [Polymorphobacter arshaanensis]